MEKYKVVSGGVTAPKGFLAGGVHCGVKRSMRKKDLALVFSETSCNAAGLYTKNKVKGAPLIVTKENLSNGIAQAVLCNAGNANTCNADGVEKAKKMCELAAEALHIKADDIIVASTGVIGVPMPIEPIASGIPKLIKAISIDGASDAAQAIMTTDTFIKEYAVSFEIANITCTIGGMAKGSGMLHPNMATMLAFLTSDVAITPEMLEKALLADVDDSFNMLSVDGDTSTNDMVTVMANGMAKNPVIDREGEAFEIFCGALAAITREFSRMMAKDGEGATKLLTCNVTGAPDKRTARIAAKSVITSSLVKAAMFGEDANWGRILCALGYADCDLIIETIDVSLRSNAGTIKVCKNGAGVDFSEEKAAEILHEKEIDIDVSLGKGNYTATAWGCDLTYDYVKINGDYRT